MKVAKHLSKKGKTYWTVEAESSLEHQRLANVAGLNPSKYRKPGGFGCWFTGTQSTLDLALVCADGITPARPTTDVPDPRPWDNLDPVELDAMTVPDLRTLASDKARALRPSEPRTPISQTWTRAELLGWLLADTWPTKASPAPAMFPDPDTLNGKPPRRPETPLGGTSAPAPGGSLEEVLAGALAPFLAPGAAPLDEERVRELIREETGGRPAPTMVEVIYPDGREPLALGLTHAHFPRLLRWASAGKHVLLVGPPGTGKSFAAGQVARALQSACFEVTSFCAHSTKSDLLGFVDAGGTYHASPFRRAWETGGVWLADEIDAAPSAVLVLLNDALAQRRCGWPDQPPTEAHPGFRCILGANTDLRGPTREFTGRQSIDGATRDRYAFLQWPIDEALELAASPHQGWTKRVQALRAAAAKARVDLIISPRASIDGGDLVALGEDFEVVEEAYVWRLCKPEIRAQVLSVLKGGAA